MNNGYSICFNSWALDNDIKNELGLLLIISSLCAEKGYCYASNQKFAELFKIDEVSVSRKIKKLEKKGYINITYEKRGCEVKNRFIRLTKMLIDDLQKNQSTINKNVKENIISNNIIIKEIDNNKLLSTKKDTKKPTLEEIEQYCIERNNKVNAKKFFDYYDVNNWKDKNGKEIKNWKQKMIANWEGKDNIKTSRQKQEEVIERFLKGGN